MKLAIVGSQEKSFSTDAQIRVVRRTIDMIFTHHLILKNDMEEFVSGGAAGVDTWAEEMADLVGIKKTIFRPVEFNWTSFKARNILIANACDVMYVIRGMNSKTYGSGWTGDYAESIGKEVYRYVV